MFEMEGDDDEQRAAAIKRGERWRKRETVVASQ
jgi:hypothetical protein